MNSFYWNDYFRLRLVHEINEVNKTQFTSHDLLFFIADNECFQFPRHEIISKLSVVDIFRFTSVKHLWIVHRFPIGVTKRVVAVAELVMACKEKPFAGTAYRTGNCINGGSMKPTTGPLDVVGKTAPGGVCPTPAIVAIAGAAPTFKNDA
jgi:hypothetical protein